MPNLSDMTTYIRAIVSDEEKLSVRQKQQELGLNEAQLIRRGLRLLGVEIEEAKAIGVSTGNPPNQLAPRKVTPEIVTQVKADYGNLTWKQMQNKYQLSVRTLSKILADEIRRKS